MSGRVIARSQGTSGTGLLDPSYQHLIGLAHRLRPVSRARSRDADLLRNRQCRRTVDHRFALSNPALVSAPAKKSFFNINWPILACRAFRSTGSLDGAPAAPNTSAARSYSCRFHSVFLFGCTSNCYANSASIRSPLTVASATLALNAVECVRRVLCAIFLVPLPALSPAQVPSALLIRLSEFLRPRLFAPRFQSAQQHISCTAPA